MRTMLFRRLSAAPRPPHHPAPQWARHTKCGSPRARTAANRPRRAAPCTADALPAGARPPAKPHTPPAPTPRFWAAPPLGQHFGIVPCRLPQTAQRGIFFEYDLPVGSGKNFQRVALTDMLRFSYLLGDDNASQFVDAAYNSCGFHSNSPSLLFMVVSAFVYGSICKSCLFIPERSALCCKPPSAIWKKTAAI